MFINRQCLKVLHYSYNLVIHIIIYGAYFNSKLDELFWTALEYTIENTKCLNLSKSIL